MNTVIIALILSGGLSLVNCKIDIPGFNFENLNKYAHAHRPIMSLRRSMSEASKDFFDNGPYPAQLPEPLSAIVPSTLHSIYQGSKAEGDKRVYNYKFDYEPKSFGHQIYANGLFNCIVTHLAVETQESIPILLRGGVGYRFFTTIVKAKAGVRLQGRIRAYCRAPPEEGINIHADVDI